MSAAEATACPSWCEDCMPGDEGDRPIHQTRMFAGVQAMFNPGGGEYRWHVGYLDSDFYGETAAEMTQDLREYAHGLLALADYVDEIEAGS